MKFLNTLNDRISARLLQEHFSHTHDLYQTEVNSTTASLQTQLENISERTHKVGWGGREGGREGEGGGREGEYINLLL